jgi:hypothetical protein
MEKFLTQLGNALSTVWGWIVLILTAAFTFIEPEKTSFIVVGGAVAADLFWGVIAAVKMNKFIVSAAFRETIKKVGIYSFALLGALAIEKITHTEGSFIAVRTIAVFAAVCEFWSMSASMLIIYPNMPFLRIFRSQLKGEIKSKLSKNVDIDEIFKDDHYGEKKNRQ